MQEADRWPQDQVDQLITWWSHFGTRYLAAALGRPAPAVQRQATALGLPRLPRAQRLCAGCRVNRQSGGKHGLLCPACFRTRRREQRGAQPRTLEQWIGEALTV